MLLHLLADLLPGSHRLDDDSDVLDEITDGLVGLGQRELLHVHPTGETVVGIHHEEAGTAGPAILSQPREYFGHRAVLPEQPRPGVHQGAGTVRRVAQRRTHLLRRAFSNERKQALALVLVEPGQQVGEPNRVELAHRLCHDRSGQRSQELLADVRRQTLPDREHRRHRLALEDLDLRRGLHPLERPDGRGGVA